jgi:LEA14-like dessication related protein
MIRHVLAIAAVLTAFAGCSTFEARDPLQVSVAAIEPMQEKGDGMELRLLVRLRVQNPNSTEIAWDGAYVKVEVQDRTFATGVSDAGGTLGGFSETMVEVPVTIPMLRMVRHFVGMMDDPPSEQVSYAMSGKLGGHRFKATGEFSLKPPPPEAPVETI